MDYLESCLRHKSEMVIYEAAHAIANLRRTGSRELAPAIAVLQLFCSSPISLPYALLPFGPYYEM
jgi:coatomer protein complex subunit gamma